MSHTTAEAEAMFMKAHGIDLSPPAFQRLVHDVVHPFLRVYLRVYLANSANELSGRGQGPPPGGLRLRTEALGREGPDCARRRGVCSARPGEPDGAGSRQASRGGPAAGCASV